MGIGRIALAAYTFYDSWIAVLVLSPYLFLYVKENKKILIKQKKDRLGMQFKDAMLAVSFSLNVGYSMENAFREAISELILLYGKQGEIVLAFQNIVRRVARNENIEDVLSDFAKESEVEDIVYFAEVFRYAKRSGGDLVSIIKNTAALIREKQEVRNEIQTIISGKKMEQSVMSVMPFGIVLYLRITSPEFIEPLYGNLAGITVMTICLGLYAAADYLAKRIVQIDV